MPKKPSKKTTQIYAPFCQVSGAISSAMVNVPATVTVHAYNIFNQPITVGGGTFRDRMVGPTKPTTNWTDLGNGTYILTYVCTQPGNYKLVIRARGNRVQGAPFHITVPTVPTPSDKSTASGALVSQGTVNTPFDINVQAKDSNGNNIPVGGATVIASIINGPQGFTPFSITLADNGNGTYSSITSGITSTGVYMTSVTVNGNEIIDSPFTFNSYLASPVSTLTVPSTAVVPNNVTAVIQGKTLSGTNVTTGEGADLFSVTVVGPGSLVVPATVTDNGNGTYNAVFQTVTAGAYTVSAVLSTINIVGSPAVCNATSSGTPTLTPSLCFADGTGIASGQQNYFAQFVVTTVDQNSNVFYSSSAVVAGTATTTSTSYPVTVVDNANGTYSCKYLPTTTETVTLAVTVNGTAINSSPFTGIVVVSSCYAPNCIVAVDPLNPAGNFSGWQFSMNDFNGNPVTSFHDNFIMTVSNGYPLQAISFQPSFPGVGLLSFFGPIVGPCSGLLQITNDVNTLAMSGSPYNVNFV
jgi:adhesin/invasin